MEYELVYGLPKAEVLAQMAEEFTEAAQAALKLRRVMDGTNPTPVSFDAAMENLLEELADCQLCKDVFFHGMDAKSMEHAESEIERIKGEKFTRWESRLETAKMALYVVYIGECDKVLDAFSVSAISPEYAEKFAKDLYHKMHPTVPMERVEVSVKRARPY